MLTGTIWSTIHCCLGYMAIPIYVPICFFLTCHCFYLLNWAAFIHFQPLFYSIAVLHYSYLFANLVTFSIGSLSYVSVCSIVKGVQHCLRSAALLKECSLHQTPSTPCHAALPVSHSPLPSWGLTCTPQSHHLSSNSRQAVLYQRYIVLGAPRVLPFTAYIAVPCGV